ncbi:MAG TPA: molybdopterin-dependent oxidoreductase [Pseudonocardiaceae bacterium]|nr:molybdopterin-dependent oxidoreductase [Pseudonocardiaceae bacterium]
MTAVTNAEQPEVPTPQKGPALPWWAAALVGVLGIAAALAIGQLVAAPFGSGASPYLAVGDVFVNHVSAPLKEFAVRNFGTDDKKVLLGSMGAVLLIFGAVAGLVSRRRPQPGMVFATVLGVIGVVAVLARPDVSGFGVIAPVASLLGGVAVFAWLHRRAMDWLHTSPSAGALVYATSRRRFLSGSAGIAIGAGIAGYGGNLLVERTSAAQSRAAVGPLTASVRAPAIPAGADFASTGTPSYLTDNGDFYRIDTELTVPQVTTQDWSLRIHGMVDRELNFSYPDIHNRPLVEQLVTLTCVSNPVGGQYISTSRFIGVPLATLLAEAGVRPGADQLLSTSVDGWTAGTPIEMLTDPKVGALLAIGMNGQPLPTEHGFPARMVVPGLYGYVSATKWVTDMEVTTFSAKQGYWVPRGYSQQAPIKTEARIDTPGSFAKVKSGAVPVAGIAWAQTKGIAKVEVRVDGGRWATAQLSTQVSKNTWRMWRTYLTLRSGDHTVEARATDQTGYTQTAEVADEIPNGASGYPAIQFSVS